MSSARDSLGDLSFRDLVVRKSSHVGTTQATAESYIDVSGNLIKVASLGGTYDSGTTSGKWKVVVKPPGSFLNDAEANAQILVEPTRASVQTNLRVSGTTQLTGLGANSTIRLNSNQQLAAVTGWQIVSALSDLPTPSAGVITLAANTTYFFTAFVDLAGNRLQCSANTMLRGNTSENSGITSTGLSSGALISSSWSLPMQNITITSGTAGASALNLDATANANQALDWLLVNFTDCATVGTIKNYNNWIYTQGAFINSAGLTFDGTLATIAINTSVLSGTTGGTILILPSTLTVSRRLCVIYSSFSVPSGGTGISVSASAFSTAETYILDTCNFSGASTTYLSGIDHTSNIALFVNNRGINNTSSQGQMFLTARATTTFTQSALMTKIAGTTAASTVNSKFDHSNNRLTCRATIPRRYFIMCTLSFNGGNNVPFEFGFFDSTLNAIRQPSRTRATAVGLTDQFETVTFQCITTMVDGDYLEIHAANMSSTTSLIIDNMNVTITQL